MSVVGEGLRMVRGKKRFRWQALLANVRAHRVT
jgi:hypothetical protein